jgi:hypothetical protein
MLFQFNTSDLTSAVSILTAMITPAVLISASGTLILSTSTRLGRAVDRVRNLIDRLEELAHAEQKIELYEERRKFIYYQLELVSKRNRLLQRAMTTFYMGLGVFVATSVAIGAVAVTGRGFEWLPAFLGLTGACFLFYGSVLLILETRLASQTLFAELDFSLKLSKEFVPSNVILERSKRYASPLTPLLRFARSKSKSK